MKSSTKPQNKVRARQQVRCAIYCRKSTEEGLEQEFNSLDAQREAGEAYIASQQHEGWSCLSDRYDDGGYTGANMERPSLQRLFRDIEVGRVDCIVVYKVDRLSRSLLDFARIMETLDKHRVAFVSVTQQFNTASSTGRLMMNVLLSFAQFEREIISERTRDKIAAARRKGKWVGGMPLLGYDIVDSKLVVNAEEASRVQAIFELYLELQSLIRTAAELTERGWKTKRWTTRKGIVRGGRLFDKANLFKLLNNIVYLGKVRYRDELHKGEHEAILEEGLWQRVQATLRSNGRTGGAHVRNKYGALLRGLLFCKPCAHAMSHSYCCKGKRQYRYYVCYTAQKRGWNACPSKSVPAEEIERFVVDQIRAIGNDPTIMAMTLEQARARELESLASIEKESMVVDRDVRRLGLELTKKAADAASDRHALDHLADLHERLNKAEERQRLLREQHAIIESKMVTKGEVDSALAAFDPLWQSLNPREQARVLNLLVQRVEYDGAAGKITITFHPNGLRSLGQRGTVEETEAHSCPAA